MIFWLLNLVNLCGQFCPNLIYKKYFIIRVFEIRRLFFTFLTVLVFEFSHNLSFEFEFLSFVKTWVFEFFYHKTFASQNNFNKKKLIQENFNFLWANNKIDPNFVESIFFSPNCCGHKFILWKKIKQIFLSPILFLSRFLGYNFFL